MAVLLAETDPLAGATLLGANSRTRAIAHVWELRYGDGAPLMSPCRCRKE